MLAPASVTLEPRDWIQLVTYVVLLVGLWYRLENKVNGFGERANTAEEDAKAAKALADKNAIENQVAQAERSELRERIAANETQLDAIAEELTQERLAVMSTLHSNEKAASERDAQLRERLAAITERLDIDRIVRSVVTEFKRQGDHK